MSYEERLQAPFHADDIEWRVQQAGISNGGKPYAMVLAYVTNRAIMNRLDNVFGVFGWQNIYVDLEGKAVECGIKIYNENTNEWITKYDAADQTDIESTKGGRSNAMKRAAVQLGIGRYLYKLETCFAKCATDKSYPNSQVFSKKGSQEKIYGSWQTPQLPKWALPSEKPPVTEAPKEGKSEKPKIISDADVKWVKQTIKDKAINQDAFNAYLVKNRCESIETMTIEFFADIKVMLENSTGNPDAK